MQPERPMDDDDDHELLDKVDALLKRHHPRRYAAPPAFATPPELTPAVPAYTPQPPVFTTPEPPPAVVTTERAAQSSAPLPFTEPEPAPPVAASEPPEADDIPILTEIIDTGASTPAGLPLSNEELHNLEERLFREVEARIAPQLSQAFDNALNELLGQAKIHIGTAVREHLAHELQSEHGVAPQQPPKSHM